MHTLVSTVGTHRHTEWYTEEHIQHTQSHWTCDTHQGTNQNCERTAKHTHRFTDSPAQDMYTLPHTDRNKLTQICRPPRDINTYTGSPTHKDSHINQPCNATATHHYTRRLTTRFVRFRCTQSHSHPGSCPGVAIEHCSCTGHSSLISSENLWPSLSGVKAGVWKVSSLHPFCPTPN